MRLAGVLSMILLWGRSILFGWVTLLAIAYGMEGPVARWSAPLFGAAWISTVHLMFDCATMAAAGWVAGRSNRPHGMISALIFTATLCFFDFGEALALNVPWLMHLIVDSFHDARYLDSLAASAETHVLLFGCLLAGARLSRVRQMPVSIGV